MMNERPIQVLLIDDDLEDICLLEEALAELEEVQFSRNWLQPGELLVAGDLAEAIEMIREERVDVILLALPVSNTHGVRALQRIQTSAPETPVVVLAGGDEEDLAISLVRQGAQDYLIRTELDCIPLARSLRSAIERHRLRCALRSLSLLDDLTGLYSAGGFYNVGERHWHVATLTGRDLWLYLVEVEQSGEPAAAAGESLPDKKSGDDNEPEDPDMRRILVAEHLRDWFGETAVIGRVSKDRFAIAAVAGAKNSTGELGKRFKQAIQARVKGTCGARPVRVWTSAVRKSGGPAQSLEEILRAATEALCENKRSTADLSG